MKVLIGCEESGTVREAFRALGYDAWSCDLKQSSRPSNHHIVGDIREVMFMDDWDLMAVLHPPCTRLANSGARWLDKPAKNPIADCTPEEAAAWPSMTDAEKIALTWEHLRRGAALFSDVLNADHIPHRAIENPIMHKHAKALIRNFVPHSQSLQPWQFETDEDGPDNEKKRTCFWIKGLPLLVPTGTLDGSTARDTCHKTPPGKDRGAIRSKFFVGMAAAMADQWGSYALRMKRAAA